MKTLFSIIMISTILSKPKSQVDDSFIWLEEIDNPKVLAWVKKQNNATEKELSSYSIYKDIYNESLKTLNADNRIAWPKSTKDHVYNFWQDENNVRGLWRRSPKDLYLKGQPVWENLLDIDNLSSEDNIKWVYQGVSFITPKYNKALVSLSKGGGDATVIREYDLTKKSFVSNGFYLAESKGGAIWLNKDALVVAREYGEGTLTKSGYPRQARILGRGMSMGESVILHEIPEDYIGIFLESMQYRGENCPVLHVLKDFYSVEYLVYYNNKLVKLNIPAATSVYNIIGEQLVFKIKSDWKQGNTIYTKGSLLSTNFKSLIYGET
ncbi:MAG: hypothetical protein MI922_21550 [Bacteroidales bacterium]|nr:hypothetical protein [Bacteroidales bacterium]